MRDRYLRRFGREPTFVAFEGYDAVTCIVSALAAGSDPESIRVRLRTSKVEGTRTTIAFADGPEPVQYQQWVRSPLTVAKFGDPRAPFSAATVVRSA